MRVHDATTPYEASAGVLHGVAGVALLVLGAVVLGELSADGTVVTALGIAASGAGLYLIVAGAVARGVQLARRGTRGNAS